jgi:hypothetical protein
MSQEPTGDQEDGEQPSAQPVFPERGPNREGMTADYLPDSDDWLAKTLLDINDPAAVAALSQLGVMYPEVDDLQPFVDETMDEFFKAQTSVGGLSREEYHEILSSMYGGSKDGKGDQNIVMKAMGADDDD